MNRFKYNGCDPYLYRCDMSHTNYQQCTIRNGKGLVIDNGEEGGGST